MSVVIQDTPPPEYHDVVNDDHEDETDQCRPPDYYDEMVKKY